MVRATPHAHSCWILLISLPDSDVEGLVKTGFINADSDLQDSVVTNPDMQDCDPQDLGLQDDPNNDIPNYDAFTNACDGWAETTWAATCELFGCNELATKVDVAGFCTPPDHYQAMGAFLLLTQTVREDVAGGLLADDMGLGKTLQVLLVLVVRVYLIQMADHLRLHPHRHLSADQSPGDKCPWQHKYGRLQCPCEKGGWASKIAPTLYDLPSVVFVPPHLIDHWVAEIKAHIDIGSTSPAKNFQFKVNHEKWGGGQDRSDANERFVCRKEDLATVERNENGRLTEYDGGSLMCYLTSVHIQGNGRIPDDVPVGLIVMDEAHRYRGGASPTAPFQFVEKMRNEVASPVSLYLVSGSLQALGPDAWRWAVKHFDDTAKKCAWGGYRAVVTD